MADHRVEKDTVQNGVLMAYLAKMHQCRKDPQYIFLVTEPVEKGLFERCLLSITTAACPLQDSTYATGCYFAIPINVGPYTTGLFDDNTTPVL